MYKLDNHSLKPEEGNEEQEYLYPCDLSYAELDNSYFLFCDMFASVELNEYTAYIENVEVTDAGIRLLFREINAENTQPYYKLYWIPEEYDHLVEGLPIIFECINEPDYFGTIEELMTRKVLVREVISSPKKGSHELKDKRRPFPAKLYSLWFAL